IPSASTTSPFAASAATESSLCERTMPGSVQLAISSAWLRFIARPDRGHRALVRRSWAGVACRERRSARLRRLGSDSSLGGSCLAPAARHEVGASGEEKDARDREAEKPVLRPETCLLHLNRPLVLFVVPGFGLQRRAGIVRSRLRASRDAHKRPGRSSVPRLRARRSRPATGLPGISPTRLESLSDQEAFPRGTTPEPGIFPCPAPIPVDCLELR